MKLITSLHKVYYGSKKSQHGTVLVHSTYLPEVISSVFQRSLRGYIDRLVRVDVDLR